MNTNILNNQITSEAVLTHITSLVGGIISDLSEVDTSAFLVGHTIHLFNVDALPFIKGSMDERGVVTLYWVSEQTPEELGVCISIQPTENAPKPRVENASKIFSTLRGVPVSYTKGKRIVGLPPEGIPEDKVLVSSAITATASAELGMTNILAPGAQVKALPDANGRSLVVGCFGFMQGS
jgi:hypothetical protein